MPGDQDRQGRDQRRLQSGRLPLAAERRLAAISTGGLALTAALSPAAAGLLRHQGLRAVCMVAGTAVFGVGPLHESVWNGDGEARELSRAYNEATRLALARLAAEATAAGAHGVVGVRATFSRPAWAQHAVEVAVLGTAVREPAPPAGLWLSDLSVQDWWSLRRGGWRALDFVYGHCAWVAANRPEDRSIVRRAVSAEFSHFGAALRQCRHRATRHMAEMSAGADGVVGVHIQRRLEDVRLRHMHPGRTGIADPGEGDEVEEASPLHWNDHLLLLSVTGTAVRGAPAAPPAARLVLPLGRRALGATAPVGSETTFQ